MNSTSHMLNPDNATRAARKDEHLQLALAQHDTAPAANDFDELEFIHHALGAISYSEVDSSTQVLGTNWAAPIYINGMTGGTERTGEINRMLGIAARETGVAVATGSVSIALDEPAAASSFQVLRKENPDGFVLANIGVERSTDDAKRAVELLQANALQVHLNAVQETVMPEGSRDFSTWAKHIEAIVQASPVPVVVKEVGFGLSRATRAKLRELGVSAVDVAGRGGTDFLRIENSRRPNQDFSYLTGFGQSAVCCLLDSPPVTRLQLLASGGVRNPLDVVKALALGARAVGIAGSALKAVHSGGETELIALITNWKAHITALQALLGARTITDLGERDLLIRGRVREYCELRGINATQYARRTESLELISAGDM